jgi:hypothetical protein
MSYYLVFITGKMRINRELHHTIPLEMQRQPMSWMLNIIKFATWSVTDSVRTPSLVRFNRMRGYRQKNHIYQPDA